MGDTDRVLVGIARRKPATPIAGVPVHAPEDDDFTPVSMVMDRIEATFIPTDRERTLLHLVWQHTANMELRARKRRDTGDEAALEKRIDAAETAIVDIRGENGTNGRLGALKERVDKSEGRRWWAVTAAAGLVVTVISAAIAFGSWMGSIETDVATLKAARVYRSFMPESPAAKERSQ